MAANKLWVLGEALIDFVPLADGYQPNPGGSPYNAAKAAALAGAEVEFLGGLSTDLFGDMLAEDLARHGVGIGHAHRSADPTTLAFVKMNGGDARYAFFNNGSVTARLPPRDLGALVQPGDIVDVGSISLIDLPGADNLAAAALSMAGVCTLAVDPNARPGMIRDRAAWDRRMAALLDAARIIKLSIEDLEFIRPGQTPPDFARAALGQGAALVVVTHGGDGAEAFTRGGRVAHVPPPVDVVDTVGAGDTLMGNLLADLLAGGLEGGVARIDTILRRAVIAATLNCTARGCQPPRRQAVDDALQRRSG
jgi:fructokinase